MENERKRKREVQGDDVLSHEKQSGEDTKIEDLPNHILVSILSRLSLKESERTSVLSHRWRYLWTYTSGSLDFDAWDTVDGRAMEMKRFRAWVNHVLKLHQAPQVDTFVFRFDLQWRAGFLDKWICHALKKEAKNLRIELALYPRFRGGYEFPNLQKSLNSYGLESTFGFLKSLRLAYVDLRDETLRYILAVCMNLECLSIRASRSTRNPQFVDPLPNFKSLEISYCFNMKSLDISVASLVSFTCDGPMVDFSFKNVPNLSEVALKHDFSESFLFEADRHLSYSCQLERVKLHLPRKLVERPHQGPAYYESPYLPQFHSLKRLEIITFSVVGRSLLFFTKLIKACSLLHEFKIKIEYSLYQRAERAVLFPKVDTANVPIFHHENLKLVELCGYIGSSSEEEFLTQLVKIAPSLEKMIIDTQGDQFDLPKELETARKGPEKIPNYTYAISRIEAKELAEQLRLKIPGVKQLVII